MADQPCSSYKCEDGSTSPCYSDRSTPPYLQWARDLNSLLKDPNGYAVFEKFLIHELGHANELMFFYACEGMKIAYQDSQKSIKETTNDADKKIKESQWAQYMKHFYHEYIVHNSRIAMPCIRSEVRLEVHNLIGKVDRHLDLVILVQKEVEEVLRTRHALFVESDEYISYIQAKEGHIVAENPNSQVGGMTGIATAGDAMATSTASMDEARPPSRLLSTVLEESEIDSLPDNEPQITHYHTLPGRLSSAAASTSVDSPYNFKDKSDPRSQVASQISLDSAPKLTQSLLKKTYQNRIQNTNGFLSSRPNEPPNPYHTARPYKPYLTTSTQDSERQSMSSGTNTESLKMCRSEQSRNSNSENRLNDRRFLHHVDCQAQRFPANRDTFNHIPRTEQPRFADHQSQNMLNESYRKAVISKLEELKHQMELRRSIKENPRKAIQEYCANINKNVNNNNEPPHIILDAHMSILGDPWGDSLKNSPSRSPGVNHRRDRSPLPQNIAPNVINRMMTSYPLRGVASFLSPNNAASICSTTPQSSCSRAKIDNEDPGVTTLQENFPIMLSYLEFNQDHFKSLLSSIMIAVDKFRKLLERPHCFLPQHSQLESQNARAYSSETSLQQQQAPSSSGNQEPNQTGIFVTHHQPYLTSFESEMGHHQPTTSLAASQRFSAISRYTSDGTSGFWSGFQSNESTASKTLPKGKAKTIHNVAASGSSTINKSQISTNPNRHVPAQDDIKQRFNQLSSPIYNGSHSALNIDNAQKTICIIYFLPNERTPFRTKFTCSESYKIRLKDFKKLIPRKYSSAKFFFKSEDESGNAFFEDISNEDEELPLIKVNEITARIDC